MTDARRPLHVGVFVGLSAGAYALSLAGVTALQARSEAAIAADRVPTADAISQLAAQNDSLEANARRAGLTFDRAAGAYDRVGQAMADVEGRLGELAKTVQAVEGASRALPDRVALPQVNRTVTTIKSPTVHATTSASGG
jgi:methyl-accepting chemotaxis protein